MREFFFRLRSKLSLHRGLHATTAMLAKSGDKARDGKDWVAAERYYSGYLDANADDASIWVQLGHALKEQGKLRAAERVYRQAIDLMPDDADAHLQLGHALKLQAKLNAAASCYARSLELLPSRDAFEELLASGNRQHANQLAERINRFLTTHSLVYFEIDDLFTYLRAHRTLSGIQRVQVGVIRTILTEVLNRPSRRYAFVRTVDVGESEEPQLRELWLDDVRDIIECATGAHVVHKELIRLLNRAEQRGLDVKISVGQRYFILGAFWVFSGDAARFARLKRAGAVVGLYIYDLIPLTHPEYCDDHLVSEFTLALGDGFAAFDYIFAISESTAQEVRHFQDKLKLRRVPVEVVPLANTLNDESPKFDDSENEEVEWSESIAALRHRRFVLYVSTIEARKNHAYLLAAWGSFLEEGLDPPDLVFVGRQGWRVDGLTELLLATGFLGGRVRILQDLPDSDLTALYRHCQFTVFPSFVEGWGLPVGESLSYGRPCVASDSSSIPEVGGDLVDYINPYDLSEGVKVLRRMAFDDDYRAKRETDVRKGFVARTWREVTSDLLARIEQMGNSSSESLVPLLDSGELFFPSKFAVGQAVPLNYLTRPLRTILAESWYSPDKLGVWMRGNKGLLRFRTASPSKTAVVICLRLLGAECASSQLVNIAVADPELDSQARVARKEHSVTATNTPAIATTISPREFVVRAEGYTSAGGIIEVMIAVHGPVGDVPEDESRQFSIGLVGLVYSENDNANIIFNIAEALGGK